MFSLRLSLALDSGAITLPTEGRIAVFGAESGADLADLPKDRTLAIQTMRPLYDAISASGFDVATAPEGRFALSIVRLPRAKAEARSLIALAANMTDGALVIDGQKTDGADSLLRDCRKRSTVGEVISKAHGKIFSLTDGAFGDWMPPSKPTKVDGYVTAPGVFSADGIDPGSMLLAEALPAKLGGRVVDLGAGWGYLSDRILKFDAVTHLDVVEAQSTALDAARENIKDSRAAFHWADARSFRPEALADHVVTNPPFHDGRKADPSLGRAFIAQAMRIVSPRGQLWLVANRHLPYETALSEAFQEVTELGNHRSFKLFHAARPVRRRTRD